MKLRIKRIVIIILVGLMIFSLILIGNINDAKALNIEKYTEKELSDMFIEKTENIVYERNLSDLEVSGDVISNDTKDDLDLAENRTDFTIEERIDNACFVYDVPYNLAISIARLETGWFTSDAYIYGNNPGGLSRNEVPIKFGSIEDGVDRFVRNLRENYLDQGLDTPEKIAKKYCPINKNYAKELRKMMSYR
jgi:hypothetical protein